MADGATISISTEVWSKRLLAYASFLKKGLQEALSEEWPFLIRKLIDFTPPFKTGGARGASDLSVGRAAVARDIEKVMRPFDPSAIRTKSLRSIVEKKDAEAFNVIAARSKSPLLRGARAVPFSPATHKSARNYRGRVDGKPRNQVVLGSDAKLLKSYVAEEQSFVGVAKSGWASAYNLVRDPEGASLPAYVSRQDASHWGAVLDDRANESNPSITAINRTPWAARKDEGERVKAAAFASRAVAITSKLKTAIRLAREQSEFNGKAA